MIRINRLFLKAAEGARASQLPVGLTALLEQGVLFEESRFFLKGLRSADTNANIISLQDDTGYEGFVNHIHIDDYADENILGCAIEFTKRVLRLSRTLEGSQEIIAVIATSDETDVSVRFYAKRVGISWAAADLDDYKEEGLLELSSYDEVFFTVLEQLRPA